MIPLERANSISTISSGSLVFEVAIGVLVEIEFELAVEKLSQFHSYSGKRMHLNNKSK